MFENICDYFSSPTSCQESHDYCIDFAEQYDGADQSDQIYADCMADEAWWDDKYQDED